MQIPTLAGVCTYEEAAQTGFSIDENVHRLLRYSWIEKRVMEAGLYWMNPTPEWEVKEALSLHLYLAAEHVKLIRGRISEMRNPPPRMDISPSASLDAFLDELLLGEDTLERLVGLYGVLKPALLAAYQDHYAQANPLIDYPTRRVLKSMLDDEEETMVWGRAAIAALTESAEAKTRAQAWTAHLAAYLAAAGGIAGQEPAERAKEDAANSASVAGNGKTDVQEALPAPRSTGEFTPDYFPQRDERFPHTWNFVFPPHFVARMPEASIEEKTLALMCKRALEMDVPEAMARMIGEAEGESWDYYVDMCRQLWDEARHAMMGEIYFETRGIRDWREKVVLHIGFSLKLNQHLTPLEAHAILYVIEQGLMPAKTGKKYEWDVAREAKDPLAIVFQDYDWADEVLHAQIGRRWLLPRMGKSRDEVMALGQAIMADYMSVLQPYTERAPQVDWWPDFVRQVLDRDATPLDVNVRKQVGTK